MQFFFQFITRESNFKKGENKSKNSFLKINTFV